VANQLLSSRIKAQTLPPTPAVAESSIGELNPTPTTSYLVHAYINKEGILRIIVNNPQRLRFMIKLAGREDQSFYEDISTLDNYRRWLDLSPIGYGSYQLTVRIDNKPVIFKLNKQPARDIYDIHPLSAVNPPVTAEPYQEADKHPVAPITVSY
jgi:hypothetical protein